MTERRTDLETRRAVDLTTHLLKEPVVHFNNKIHHVNLENCLHYAKMSVLNKDTVLLNEVKNALKYILEKA